MVFLQSSFCGLPLSPCVLPYLPVSLCVSLFFIVTGHFKQYNVAVLEIRLTLLYPRVCSCYLLWLFIWWLCWTFKSSVKSVSFITWGHMTGSFQAWNESPPLLKDPALYKGMPAVFPWLILLPSPLHLLLALSPRVIQRWETGAFSSLSCACVWPCVWPSGSLGICWGSSNPLRTFVPQISCKVLVSLLFASVGTAASGSC